MKKVTNFGAIPAGLSFQFLNSKQIWFVNTDRRAFSFKSDGNTKLWTTPKFDEMVICLNSREL